MYLLIVGLLGYLQVILGLRLQLGLIINYMPMSGECAGYRLFNKFNIILLGCQETL